MIYSMAPMGSTMIRSTQREILMPGTTNIFGLLQPAGTTDPLAILAGSPLHADMTNIVAALYGVGLTATQVASQTVADPSKVVLPLAAGQVGEELFNDNDSLTLPIGSIPETGVVLYDNSDVVDKEIVSFGNGLPNDTLNVLLGGYFQILSTSAQAAFIIADAADGGGSISHASALILEPSGDQTGNSCYVEDDVGIAVTFSSGTNFLNETGTGFDVIGAVPAGFSATSLVITGNGSGGQIEVAGASTITQTGSGDVQVDAGKGGTFIHSGTGSVNASSQGATINMVHGDLTLSSQGGDLLALGDGTAAITVGGSAQNDDTIIAGSGATTITGANATVFGGSGTLDFSGGGGLLVLGSGNSTIGGGVAGTQDEVFGGSGTTIYNGDAEKGFLIAGSGSVTVTAGSGGGWYTGGSNGNNSLTATGIGTVLVGGGNGDTLTGAAGGWNYLIAASGNETLVGGNQSGTDFFFGGSGAERLNLGTGTSIINPGTGTETIDGSGGTSQLWVAASNGAVLFDAGLGGAATAIGFRLGTDHIGLGGQSVTSEKFSGGATMLTLSGGGTIQLDGLDATKATNLFG